MVAFLAAPLAACIVAPVVALVLTQCCFVIGAEPSFAQASATGKNPYEILSEAKNNAAANGKNGDAQTDLAIYTYMYEDRDRALELYKKALAVAPADWRASVGLLQSEAFSYSLMVKDRMKGAPAQDKKVQMQAAKTENLVKRLPSGKERDLALFTLSRTFFEMRQYSRAKTLAEMMQPSPARREAVLKATLILPVVDKEVALPLFQRFLADGHADFDEDLWYLIIKRLLPGSKTWLKTNYRAVSAALERGKANESLLLSYGLVLGEDLPGQSSKYLELAYKSHADDLAIALAYARRLWLDGQKGRSEDLVKELLRVNKNSEYDSRHITASYLAQRALDFLAGKKGELLVKHARLSGWHCDCSGNGLKQVLLQNRAVRYAHLQLAEGGKATLFVEKSSPGDDAALMSEALFKPLSKQVKVTPLPDGKPLTGFLPLVATILETEEAYYLPLPGLYRFVPPSAHKSL